MLILPWLGCVMLATLVLVCCWAYRFAHHDHIERRGDREGSPRTLDLFVDVVLEDIDDYHRGRVHYDN